VVNQVQNAETQAPDISVENSRDEKNTIYKAENKPEDYVTQIEYNLPDLYNKDKFNKRILNDKINFNVINEIYADIENDIRSMYNELKIPLPRNLNDRLARNKKEYYKINTIEDFDNITSIADMPEVVKTLYNKRKWLKENGYKLSIDDLEEQQENLDMQTLQYIDLFKEVDGLYKQKINNKNIFNNEINIYNNNIVKYKRAVTNYQEGKITKDELIKAKEVFDKTNSEFLDNKIKEKKRINKLLNGKFYDLMNEKVRTSINILDDFELDDQKVITEIPEILKSLPQTEGKSLK